MRHARAARRLARAALPVLVAAALAAAAPSACSPYDPSLPTTPFVCSDDEPRCPDGYICVADPDGRNLCRARGLVVDANVADSAPSSK